MPMSRVLSSFQTKFCDSVFRVLLVSACLLSTPGAQPPLIIDDEPATTAPKSENLPLNLHQWGSIGLLHGLPSDKVNAISQDTLGALWFGCDAGLVRYDGRKAEIIGGSGDARGTLPSQRVRSLKRDSTGTIWIGTEAGAARFANGRIQTEDSTRGFVITSVSENPGGIVILTCEQGKLLLGKRQKNIKRSDPNHREEITWQVIDSKLAPLLKGRNGDTPLTGGAWNSSYNKFLIASRGRGLLTLTAEGMLAEFPGNAGLYLLNFISGSTTGFYVGADAGKADKGAAYLSQDGHLTRLDADTGTVNAVYSNESVSGTEDEVWIATEHRGAFLLSGGHPLEHATIESTNGGLRSNRVLAVFRDRDGVVWFGTDRGVCRYDRESLKIEQVSGASQDNYVRTVLATRSSRVLAGTNRGLFERESGIWRALEGIEPTRIYSLYEDSRGALWVGTDHNLYVQAAPGRPYEIKVSGYAIRSLTEMRNGNIAFIGSRDGQRSIWQLSGQGAVEIASPSTRGEAMTLAVHTPTGNLLAGTTKGELLTINPETGELLSRKRAVADGKAVQAIGLSSDQVWLGTEDGVYRERNGQFETFAVGCDVQAIALKGEKVFLATRNSGVVQLRKDAPGVVSFLSNEDGLPTRQCFSLSIDDKGLWIGTNRGMARFRDSGVKPTVEARRLVADMVYDQAYLVDELRFPGSQKNYLLEVAAYGTKTFPSQFQYEFVVAEESRGELKRVISPESQLSLTGLGEGYYIVTVRAISRDLEYSEPYQLKLWISAEPVSGATILLASLLAAVTVLAAFAFIQQRRTAKANRELGTANGELRDMRSRLASSTEAERSRIARDLHDQTLADLRQALLMTDRLKEEGTDQTKATELRRKIEAVSGDIRRICEDLSPSALTNLGFIPALEWAFANAISHQAAGLRPATIFECPAGLEERLKLSPSEQIQLYRIILEAISNVASHAQASRIELRVEVRGANDLEISVLDDGIGFEPGEHSATGHGLGNIRSRAGLIGAAVTWRQGSPGCVFSVLLPGVVSPEAEIAD